jgi:hypothetical protein
MEVEKKEKLATIQAIDEANICMSKKYNAMEV